MQPTFFINHGGGPCFFLQPGPMRSAWAGLEDYLASFQARLASRPSAILIASGHWEAPQPTLNNAANPPLLFDYGGFPDYTYELQWPAPGAPGLAQVVAGLLGQAGIAASFDDRRGWDHGVFVPLKVMFPSAEIPTLQLSLQHGLDAETHLAIGRALQPLRAENVLIIGSGQSYHNMRGFGSAGRDPEAAAFDDWLQAVVLDPAIRDEALTQWERAPGARAAQPHEDHLLPLMVAAGAASGEPAALEFHGDVLGKPISGFRFG